MVVEVGGGVVDRPRTKVNGDDDQDEDIRRTKRTTAIIIVEAAVAAAVVVVVVAFVLLLRAVVVVVLVVDDFDSSNVVAVRLSSSSFMVCSPIFGFFGSCWIDRAIGVVVLFPARCHLGPIAALSWKLCFIPGPRLRQIT